MIILRDIFLLTVAVVLAKYNDWESIVPYCEVAPVKCSLDRNDDAFMPYNGSRCYCDYFCFRNKNDHDCCPDFEYVCDQLPNFPQELYDPSSSSDKIVRHCEWDKQIYRKGETRTDDCNLCSCELIEIDLRILPQWNCEQDLCANSDEVMRLIEKQKYWTASKYSRWNKAKYMKLKSYSLGTILDSEQKRILNNYNSRDPHIDFHSFIPPDNWIASQGGWEIGPVRDQGMCGVSWALSAVDVASDRVSLNEDDKQEQLSVQYVVSCSSRFAKEGCRAGRIGYSWGFLKDFGVPPESFYPYESGRTGLVGYCAHSPDLDSLKPADYVPLSTHHRFSPAYKINEDTLQIKYEMFERGPVQATMLVCPDFYQYKSGIYKSVWPADDRTLCDYHSVRMVGWGKHLDHEGNTVEYWICINSWGTEWGENGYFKIEIKDSDINQYIISTWGRTSKFHVRR